MSVLRRVLVVACVAVWPSLALADLAPGHPACIEGSRWQGGRCQPLECKRDADCEEGRCLERSFCASSSTQLDARGKPKTVTGVSTRCGTGMCWSGTCTKFRVCVDPAVEERERAEANSHDVPAPDDSASAPAASPSSDALPEPTREPARTTPQPTNPGPEKAAAPPAAKGCSLASGKATSTSRSWSALVLGTLLLRTRRRLRRRSLRLSALS